MTSRDPDRRLLPPPAGPPGPRAVPGLPGLPRPGEELGFTLARTAVLACAGAAFDRVLRLPPDRAWAVLGLLTVLALTPAARPVSAAAGAGVTWLIGTGFVVHRFGELSFDGGDQARLAVLALAGVVALLVSRRAATVTRGELRGEQEGE